ncbi:MAG: terpene cyclase/mutase family protein, partial [Planctomycetota bacterium]|nr:terpene cyclase/mutase family protein [Planctomycetota bacterium]
MNHFKVFLLIFLIIFSQSGVTQDENFQQQPQQQPPPQGQKQDEKKEEKPLTPPSREEIEAAVRKGVEWLLALQKPDGSFDGIYASSYGMGNTALCLLALLKSGVRRDHPSIQKGFAYAMKLPLQQVYSVSIMIMALEAYYEPTEAELEKVGKSLKTTPAELVAKRVEPTTRKWISDAVEWLISKQQANIWRYPEGGEDVSNTQYALLALNAAMRMKIQVPPAVFKKAADYFLKYQGESKEEFKPTFKVPAADFSISQLRQMEKDYYKRLTEQAKEAKKEGEKTSTDDVKKPKTELAEDPYRRFGVEEANFKMYPRGWQYVAPAPYKTADGKEMPAPPVRGTGSMTTAGLAALIICKAGLEGSPFWTKEYSAQVNQAIRDGAAWIAKYFAVSGNPYEGTASPSSSHHYYYPVSYTHL